MNTIPYMYVIVVKKMSGHQSEHTYVYSPRQIQFKNRQKIAVNFPCMQHHLCIGKKINFGYFSIYLISRIN